MNKAKNSIKWMKDINRHIIEGICMNSKCYKMLHNVMKCK